MRRIGNVVAAVSLATGAACGEFAIVPDTDITVGEILDNPNTVRICPGGSEIVSPETDDEVIEHLSLKIGRVDFQHPRGIRDTGAPTLGAMPMRLDANVDLNGEGKLDNDLAGDTVNIDLERFSDKTAVCLGALALGAGENDKVLISWPKQNGEPGSTFYVSMHQGSEPEGGVVLVSFQETETSPRVVERPVQRL